MNPSTHQRLLELAKLLQKLDVLSDEEFNHFFDCLILRRLERMECVLNKIYKPDPQNVSLLDLENKVS